MVKIEISEKIEIPKEVEIKVNDGIITAKGAKGEINKNLLSKKVIISSDGNSITLSAKKATKREKRLAGTFKSHIKNMIEGVSEGFVYQLKICSSHFPMTVEIKDNILSINNFLGETVPRTTNIKEDVDIKIEGDIITMI